MCGADGVTVKAQSSRGERWARVTLDQLAALSGCSGKVPCCRIIDWPRLKWRGFMLDTARNYLPPQGIKDVLDVMSRYKLNLFHWHITEDYAWRLESKKYPQLQSERAFFSRHKGKFYTHEEFREIVDYAYERGICIMPEFDLPGHSTAFRNAFGFKTMSEPGVAATVAALFDELCSLVPKEKMPFIHMGTDEVCNRDIEGAPREMLEMAASVIAKHGRTAVRWVPGEEFDCSGPFVNMLWTTEVSPDRNPGPYFDAIGMYIEDFDPFELLSVAVYHKAAKWHDAGNLNMGAVFCAWHDGFAGMPYENLLRNQQVFPSCVLFGNAYWRGCDEDMPEFRKCLPRGGDPKLSAAVNIERRVIAQRDRVLAGLRHPFHFLGQTDMRWRLMQTDGTLIATDIAQATISPRRLSGLSGGVISPSNGTVIAETWIKSPKDQTVGAWIGFTNISRDHGLADSAPLPDVGEWNRFGASVELNGERLAPPKWMRPGLRKGDVAVTWAAGAVYEVDEEPFTDQEYYMREPTRILLREGWNHVRLTIPNPMAHGAGKHRWAATFIPVAGTTDHPCEVAGLEYSSVPPWRTAEVTSVPVRPGDTKKGIPFWNDYAVFFRYAPAFKFKPVAGAVRYRFTLMRTDATNRVPSASFLAGSPEAPLSPVWDGLSNARWTVFCDGMDSNGKSLGSSGARTFVKTAAFTGCHAGAKRSYREAARMIYEYMTALPAMKTLVETGRPDQNYQHNAYPSKTHAAHVMAMLDWAASDPANGEKARRFARASGEYLLSQLERPDAPLAYWPPTYGRKPLACDQSGKDGKKRHAMVGNDPEGAAKYRGQVMSLYPADVGVAFLALAKATGDGRYIEAAKGIGETYLKIRRSDGTWALKYWLETGEVQCGNNLVPTRPMALFEKLADVTGDVKWRKAADDCFVWLEKGPLSDWNWDGQFEDIEPRPPYQDLTKHNAIETLFYLLKRRSEDSLSLAKARDLLRWSEDQFVFWEPPCGPDDELESPGGKNKKFYPGRWHYPSVYEQYSCYISIDASASKMIAAYLAMYRVDGDPLDLEKAKALADAITQVQEPSGRVPTFWSAGSKAGWLAEERYDWLNCMASCAKALMDVADVVGHKRSH